MKYLLPTFIVMPILEMYVLIQVGSYIGALETIGLVLLTAVLGLALLRQQGFEAMSSARMKLQQSEIPAEEILTGFFLAIGGVLLITPGFITDAFGFLLLIPNTRTAIKQWLHRQIEFRYTSTRPDETIIEQ